VLVQSETMRANVGAVTAEASDVLAAEASHVFAAKASDVASAAKAAAHVAAATEAAAVTAAASATTARVGRDRHQAGSEKRGCQYRDHPFHHDTPFRSDCSAP
jgi:hypothetical protein